MYTNTLLSKYTQICIKFKVACAKEEGNSKFTPNTQNYFFLIPVNTVYASKLHLYSHEYSIFY